MGCAQPKPKPPQSIDQASKPLQSNPAGNASSQVKADNANSSFTDKQTNQNVAKENNGFGLQGSGLGAQGYGNQGFGIQGAGSAVKESELTKQKGETVEYRQNGASFGNSGISEEKANNVPASGFKPTSSEFRPGNSTYSEAKNNQLNSAYNSPNKNEQFNQSALPSQSQNKYGSENFNNNESIHKKASELSKNSNYESVKKSNRDDDGFVPEDSLMDYGQTTITDPSKIEVHFHM